MNVPKMRFKEFRSAWENAKLETLLIESKEKSLGNDNGIVLTSSRKGLFPRSTYFDGREENNTIGYSLVPRNSFTYRQMSDDNTFFINLNKDFELGLVSPEYPVFTTNELLDTNYFAYYINDSRAFKKYCQLQKKGGTRTRLYFKVLKELEISIPDIEEQKKIGDFFEAINRKILLQQEKIDLLEEKKKGYMQKIFNREFRFKDREDQLFPEWESIELGKIGEFRTSSVNKVINETEENVFLLNYMDVYNHKIININNYKNLDENTATTQQLETNNLKKGDILFTPSSETPEDIGHSIVIPDDLPNVVYSYHLIRFRPFNTNKLDINFSHFFCNTEFVRKQIIKYATGSTRFTVSIENFSNVIVQIPTKEEQKKIAGFLELLDLKILDENKKLEQLQKQKQAFMQQMFI